MTDDYACVSVVLVLVGSWETNLKAVAAAETGAAFRCQVLHTWSWHAWRRTY